MLFTLALVAVVSLIALCASQPIEIPDDTHAEINPWT